MNPHAVKRQWFKPIFAFEQVYNPDYNLDNNGLHVWDMVMTKIKLPAGYDSTNINVRIDHKGQAMHLSFTEITLNFHGEDNYGKK